MEYSTINSIEDLKEDLSKALVAPLKKELELHKNYIKTTDALYHSYIERINRIDSANGIIKYINETNWLKDELYIQLDSEFPEKSEIKLKDYFVEYYNILGEFISTLPENIIIEQTKDHFKIQKEDEIGLRIKKPIKNIFFHISRIPVYLQNLVVKDKKKVTYWKRSVPLKAMSAHYFGNSLVEIFLNKMRELEELKCKARSVRWNINVTINKEVANLLEKETIEFTELIARLNEMAQDDELKEMVELFTQRSKEWDIFATECIEFELQNFENRKSIVGTIGLPSNKFDSIAIAQESTLIENKFQTILNGWRNTQYAQIDDFQVDLELYKLKYTALQQYFLLQSSCKTRIDSITKDHVHEIKSEFESVISQINQLNDKQDIKTILVSEKLKLNHLLETKSIPLTISALYDHNFPQLIDRLELKINDKLGEMKAKRIIYNKELYDAPISKSNLSHFNPQELVEVDILKKFSDDVQKIKTLFISSIQIVEVGLKNLIEIIDYNLDAAINSTNDLEKVEEIKQVSVEGMQRASAKTDTIESELHNITQLIHLNLKKEIDELNVDLIKLTVNENITNLRIQLAKAKAIEKTKIYRQEILNKIRNFIPIALRFLRTKFNLVKNYLVVFQERIGLLDRKSTLTNELSDFLLQTDLAIQQLPFVYRRLYEIKPLDEESFFEGRIDELSQLESAFKSWEEEKISSAVVVGEKGSGASSLINAFVRKHGNVPTIRMQLKNSISSNSEFLTFFDELLPGLELKSFEEIVDNLNNGNRRAIILEDIQQFYLKKPNGFQAINLLFELISQTAKNVFWLVGTTTFTWSYLQKTIAIERYIKHKIVLKPLTDEQIVNLILKRHRVSGYNLKFKSDDSSKLENRKLTRLNEADQQQSLRELFFEELNYFAKSNISLALLYWLRSTHSFEQNTVVIGKIKNFKFGFLYSLDVNSIFTLHTLLLHESLTVEEHAEIFHQEKKQSRMTLMVLEDEGILKMSEGRYHINQLLYRQVITVLKNKNLIH